jgi:hypothetical protein
MHIFGEENKTFNPIGFTSTEIYCVISTADLPTLHFMEITSTAPAINLSKMKHNLLCIRSVHTML